MGRGPSARRARVLGFDVLDARRARVVGALGLFLTLGWVEACAPGPYRPRASRTPTAERRVPLMKPEAEKTERTPEVVTPPRKREGSLIAKITPQTSPQRAASLRFTEEGRRLLESKEYAKALARLEQTIAIDSANPYAHYYLASVHYHLSHYKESIDFLDVAESFLDGQPDWLAKVYALKGENLRAMGYLRKAASSYSRALRLSPGDPVASAGLERVRGELAGPPLR